MWANHGPMIFEIMTRSGLSLVVSSLLLRTQYDDY